MNKKKGMSQILTLIVAASVLMMTALTLVFMTQGSLTNIFGSSNTQQCINAIKGQCNTVGGSLQKPQACQEADISDSDLETNYDFIDEVDTDGTISCSQ